MTWLGALNFVVLQWFGVRLARCEMVGKIPRGVALALGTRCTHHDNTRGASYSGRVVSVDYDSYRLRWYTAIRWIVPLTGWWSEYRWIGRRQ